MPRFLSAGLMVTVLFICFSFLIATLWFCVTFKVVFVVNNGNCSFRLSLVSAI